VASRARVWLPIIAASAFLLTTAPVRAAQYTVDSFKLGAPIAQSDLNNQHYNCTPSDEFADAVRCEYTQQTTGRAGPLKVSHALVQAQDGTAVYLTATAAPVILSQSAVQNELNDLSRVIGERPTKVDVQPATSQSPTTVIATWGQVKLEEVQGDDYDVLANGKNPHLGVLIDLVGNLQYSIEHRLTIYQMTGGAGYVYSASLDASGRGHRHYVAIDPAQIAILQFRHLLAAILQKDRSLPGNDYQLWPDVAFVTRKLALDTSVKTANAALDQVFDASHSDKLRSHVWSLLPLGAIDRLGKHLYSRLDSYGPHTEHPQVRRDVVDFLAGHPSDRFPEFAYYLVGDLNGALQANPNSIINDVLHYGSGYKIMESLMQDATRVLKIDNDRTTPPGPRSELQGLAGGGPEAANFVIQMLDVCFRRPEWHDNRPLGAVMSNFAARADAAQSHFKAVLSQPSSPLADDAGFMLGWLASQQGRPEDALAYFSQAMTVGNGDYKSFAVAGAVSVVKQFPTPKQLATVESSQVLSQHAPLWYLAARSAYRDFDYASAIDASERALEAIKVPLEQLPVTTDPDRIEAALEKINPELSYDANVQELPYLIQASKDMLRYRAYLNSATTERPDVFAVNVKKMVNTYSMLLDPPDQPARPRVVEHKDLRQAVHLIEITLAVTPANNAQYAALRRWLLFRKIRVAAVFAPDTVPAAIAALQQEFPTSVLLNDALAEQIFAEGITAKDPDAAAKTFRELLQKYPNGNAVDNAYSWMSIALHCAGRKTDADNMDREIVQRFPRTRHAEYARKRLADPGHEINPTDCGW
jgi:tetratricopeptide (TPR) repeat protein